MNPTRLVSLARLLGSLAIFLGAARSTAHAEPQPGDVFREYRYTHDTIIETDAVTRNPNPKLAQRRAIANRERGIDLWDLEDAVRAELAMELWGGHAGTSGHAVRVNGGPWTLIPQLTGTPTDPHCYLRMQLGSSIVPLPIESLRLGHNVFQFRADKQVCHARNWGIFKIYAFTVRIYYDPARKPHPEGNITLPVAGARIGDRPTVKADARGTDGDLTKIEFTGSSVLSVDYVARYEDADWDGDGRFRDWQFLTEQGDMKRHVGRATSPPFAVTWDTRWVPDQSEPVSLAARITDTHGITTMTPAIDVSLVRPGRSVKLYRATSVPENFGARDGDTKTCTIAVADDPRRARNARLVLSTWAGAHADALSLNGRKLADRIGTADYYSVDTLDFRPAGIVVRGENTFSVFSKTKLHAAEINWPGPQLLLEFGRPLK